METPTTIATPKKLVPPIGPADAKIAIVGEAPGYQEAQQGIPFVGPAGKLLNELLHSVGLIRRDIWITNVIKEHPPRNNITPYLDLSKNVPKESDSYYRYRALLKEELEGLNPNLVIAMGATALYALTGLRESLKRRGSILESNLIPGLKVIPTIHPSAALRGQFMFRHLIHFDLKKCARESLTPTIPTDDRNYILRPSFDDSVDYLSALAKKERVAFDIEVGLGQVSCISFAFTPEEAISIPFTEGVQEYFNPKQEAYIWKLVAKILEDPETPILAHNAMFDCSLLYDKYGIRSTNIDDTMVAMSILYPDMPDILKPKSLQFATSLYTNMPYYKDEGKEAIFKKGGHGLQFWQYNAKDSIVLMEMFPKMLRDLERQGNLEAYRRQNSLIPALLYMSQRGLRADAEGLKKAAEEAKHQLVEIKEKVREYMGEDVNLRSAPQMLDYFYNQQNVKPYLHQGRPTTNETALKRLAKHPKPAVAEPARLLLDHRGVAKLHDGYYTVKLDPADGRLRSSVNPVGAKTGRLSMSQTIFGLGANLQTIPKEMKPYILTDEGYVLYNIDMAQAENRIVALLSGDPTMLAAFSEGRDIHSLTGSMIARVYGENLTEEEVKELDNLFEDTGDKKYTCPLGGHRFTWRMIGKKGGHGTNYGLGKRKAALLWEVTEADANFVIESYHEMYPFIRQWHRAIYETLRQTRRIANLFGRVYQYWGDLNNSLADVIAWNPQSSNVENVNKNGVLELFYDQNTFAGCEFLLQVHDSIVLQIPLSLGWDYHSSAIRELKARLERPLVYHQRTLVIPAEVTMKAKNLLEGVKIKEVEAGNLEAAYKNAKG